MTTLSPLPRLLIIDDLFGRTVPGGYNKHRAHLCGQFMLEDITDDHPENKPSLRIKKPRARVMFHRGQQPAGAQLGDIVANDLDGALAVVRAGWDRRQPGVPPWSMVLLDLCFYTGLVTARSQQKRGVGMPEGRDDDAIPEGYFGLKLLQAISEQCPDLPIIILSSQPEDEAVRRAYAYMGAYDFLPRSADKSPEMLQSLLQEQGLLPDAAGKITGLSIPLLQALQSARILAQTRSHVLIRGERGTGKELLARYINQHSDLRHRPFVEVNSAELNSELFRSELFGIKKGVATGVEQRIGLAHKAEGGDLFFDEIKDLPPMVQAGILRFLQERRIRTAGETDVQDVDVRILSATNTDIEQMAAHGEFRADLLDRLREGGAVYLPALRDRKADIPLLAKRFVREAEEAIRNKTSVRRREITDDSFEKLQAYDWPGNIRELRSCLFKAVNTYKRIYLLTPKHLEVGASLNRRVFDVSEQGHGDSEPLATQPKTVRQAAPSPTTSAEQTASPVRTDIPSLLQAIEDFDLETLDRNGLSNHLPAIKDTFACFFVRYIHAAFLSMRSVDNQTRLTPAIRLIRGVEAQEKFMTTDAKREIKRLLKVAHNTKAVQELIETFDPAIAEAFAKADPFRDNKDT